MNLFNNQERPFSGVGKPESKSEDRRRAEDEPKEMQEGVFRSRINKKSK